MSKLVIRDATPKKVGRWSSSYRRQVILLIENGWNEFDICGLKDKRVIDCLYDTGTYYSQGETERSETYRVEQNLKEKFEELSKEHAAAETADERAAREFAETPAGAAFCVKWLKKQKLNKRENYMAGLILRYLKKEETGSAPLLIDMCKDLDVSKDIILIYVVSYAIYQKLTKNQVERFFDEFKTILSKKDIDRVRNKISV